MREPGPAEHGDGTRLTETAQQIGERFVERMPAAARALGPIHVPMDNVGRNIGHAGPSAI